MAGVRTAIRVEDAAVKTAFERLIALAGDPKAALADIGESALRTTKDRYREERAPDGSRWAPLSPKYALRKERRRGKPKILQFRGHLFLSLVYQVFPGQVVVGTNRPYGAVHQFGFGQIPGPAVARHHRGGPGRGGRDPGGSRQTAFRGFGCRQSLNPAPGATGAPCPEGYPLTPKGPKRAGGRLIAV